MGKIYMKTFLRNILVYSFIATVWVNPGFAQSAVKDSQPNNIGSFDINKVRELSTHPQPVTPAATAFPSAPQAAQKELPNYTFITLRVIGSLAIIIALIFGVTWLIRKLGIAGSSRVGGGGAMDIIEALPLGQNRNVVLFRVMDTVYLCGQTTTNISLIDKIEGQRAAELLTSSKGTSTVVHFKEAFNQFISKMKK
jgi:flagellar biosynthetic protein FliO